MELTDTQREAIAAWFADGASLDEIQKRIKIEFGVHLTYLDVRLMVAELPQPVEDHGKDDAKVADEMTAHQTEVTQLGVIAPETAEGNPQGSDQADGEESEGPMGENGTNTEAQTVSAPTVTIDALMIPGTIASGDVTFSDGQTGKWFLDQMGRLGLDGDLPQGYRPSPTDAALFQQQLMQLLQSKGLC